MRPRAALNSDVALWLDAHRAALGAATQASGVPAELVRLVAVLALEGLSDEQIRDQLWALEQKYATHQPFAAEELNIVLAAVRALLAQHPFQAIEPARRRQHRGPSRASGRE